MPANFPTQFQNTLAAFTGVQRGATTFASRLIDLMNAAFGPSNPFGTAATRDVGVAADNLPALDSAGVLPTGVLPAATTDTPGAVTLASSLDDTSATAVVLPSQVNAALAGLTQGFRADRTNIILLTLNTTFTTPGAGFLIGSSGGGGGEDSHAGSQGRTAAENAGEALTIQYGAASASAFTSSSPTLSVPGGSTVPTEGQPTTARPPGFSILPIDSAARTANRAPKFAFMLGNAGAAGGRAGFLNTQSTPGTARDGSMLIAFFDRGLHMRMTADGTGGPGDNIRPTSGRWAAGENGANGFAVFVRLD